VYARAIVLDEESLTAIIIMLFIRNKKHAITAAAPRTYHDSE
jgi:hypothetical protein